MTHVHDYLFYPPMPYFSIFLSLTNRCNTFQAENAILYCLPQIALLWRLRVVREITLSGFQLALYAKDETPFAYWYLARIIERELHCLDRLLGTIEDQQELDYERQFLTVLQLMATGTLYACPLFPLPTPV